MLDPAAFKAYDVRGLYGSDIDGDGAELITCLAGSGAPLAAELARGEAPRRVYRVEALGTIEDDPNVTDKRFPGNPTRSYRTTEPLRSALLLAIASTAGWRRSSSTRSLSAPLRRTVADRSRTAGRASRANGPIWSSELAKATIP